jgi:anthraniloyl-CoA monooxygenase
MKITIVGGGPAGLYFALLMKQQDPGHAVTVLERNPRDNTFGWGVVFSDQTLSYLEGPDRATFEAFQARLERWDNVDIVHRGEKVTIRGNRFSGIARIELLHVLQQRCLDLGVDLRFEVPIEEPGELAALAAGSDLLVGADGVKSAVRERFAADFEPSLTTERNRYVWYGTPHLFHGLTLTFRTTEAGLFIGHSYKFSRDRSTFIVECDPESWRRAGFDAMDDEAARRTLEGIFAPDLDGAPLLSNNSRWLSFVTVRNRRWSTGRVVLLGDALHTAHFSIGSGTKLALEDAIALASAFAEHRDVEPSLAAFETARRPTVERIQAAAESSLHWFETARRDLHLDPLPFAYKAMTRSDKVDHEGLRRRDPDFVAAYERHVAAGGEAAWPGFKPSGAFDAQG